jgi:hypothetical protein
MTSLLKRLSGWLGGSQIEAEQSTLQHGRDSQQSTLLEGSETAVRAQLVQVLLRDLVRKSGMPPGFVQCHIQVMNSRSRGSGIFVRLVVRDWDERLMKYAFAFQKTLLTHIVQFEPKASTWLQGLAWQLEVADTCPLTVLPGPEYWQAPKLGTVDPFDIIPLPANAVTTQALQTAVAEPKAPPSPKLSVAATLAATPLQNVPEPLPSLPEIPDLPPDETAQDLERLFAIRDNELAQMAENHQLPPGYDSTEPSPLRNG